MNLTSCDNCGVVLDKDKLPFPKDIEIEDEKYGGYLIDETKAIWRKYEGTYIPAIPCPVCKELIGKE